MLDKNKNFIGFISSSSIIGKVQLFIRSKIVRANSKKRCVEICKKLETYL